jgi:hypothetical protein
MPRITIDGIEANTEDLSDAARALLEKARFAEMQARSLREELAVLMRARQAFVADLKEALVHTPSIDASPAKGD